MKLHQSRTNDTVLAPPQPKAQPQPPQQRRPQPQYMGPSAINTPNIPPPRAAAANPNSKKPVSVHNSIKLLVQNNYRQRLAKKQQPPAPAQVAKPSYYQNGTRAPAVLNNAVKPQYQSAAAATARPAPQSSYGQRQNGWSSQNKWNNSSNWKSQSNWNNSSNWNNGSKWNNSSNWSSQSNGYNRSSYNEPLNVPKPSYTPFRSVSNNAGNQQSGPSNANTSSNQSANAQKEYGQCIKVGPEFE